MCIKVKAPSLISYPEPAPGHLHQGGIWISRGAKITLCVEGRVVRAGSVQSVIACSSWRSLKRAIAFLCALFYRFHVRFRNRSHSARRGEEVMWGAQYRHSLAGGGDTQPTNAPPISEAPSVTRDRCVVQLCSCCSFIRYMAPSLYIWAASIQK